EGAVGESIAEATDPRGHCPRAHGQWSTVKGVSSLFALRLLCLRARMASGLLAYLEVLLRVERSESLYGASGASPPSRPQSRMLRQAKLSNADRPPASGGDAGKDT